MYLILDTSRYFKIHKFLIFIFFAILNPFEPSLACNEIKLYQNLSRSPEVLEILKEHFTFETLTAIDRFCIELDIAVNNHRVEEYKSEHFHLKSTFETLLQTGEAIDTWKKTLERLPKDSKDAEELLNDSIQLENSFVKLVEILREKASHESIPFLLRPIERPKSEKEIMEEKEREFNSRVLNGKEILKDNQHRGPIFKTALMKTIDEYFMGNKKALTRTAFAAEILFLDFSSQGTAYRISINELKENNRVKAIHILKVGPRENFYDNVPRK